LDNVSEKVGNFAKITDLKILNFILNRINGTGLATCAVYNEILMFFSASSSE